MTAAAANRAEQIFAAMVLKGSNSLTSTNFASNVDQSINIVPGFNALVYRTIDGITSTYLQTPLTVNFNKFQSTAGVTPDDY